jgi:hypothetical protein
VAIVEVGMATWKANNSFQSTREPSIQASIDRAFRAEWCHLGIFGMIAPPSCGASCPPCTSWISLMNDGAAASLPRLLQWSRLYENMVSGLVESCWVMFAPHHATISQKNCNFIFGKHRTQHYERIS